MFSALFTLCLFALPVAAHAFDLSDLAKKTIASQNPDPCLTSTVSDAISKFKGGYLKQVAANISQEISQLMTKFAAQLALCFGSNVSVFGTGVSGALSCAISTGGEDAQQAAQQFLQTAESNFLANCESRYALDETFSDARNIIASNGRDGGAVYVQDWRAFQAQNRYRGLQIARNEFANTSYCPWVSGDMQAYYNYDSANAVALVGDYQDGMDSYTQSAGCTLPSGFDPSDPNQQTGEAFAALVMPQNNIWGAYMLAQDEINNQVSAEEQAAQNEYANTGGIGALRAINPATGDSCAVMAADGSTCLQYTAIQQPAGGVQAGMQAQIQASYDWLNNARAGDTSMGTPEEIEAQIVSSLLSADQPLPQFQYKLDASSTQIANFSTPTPVPGDGSPGDPLCTGGNASCTCLKNDSAAQSIATQLVLQATLAAIQQHPEMVSADGNTVLPGQNRLFLTAVCSVTVFQSGMCHPSGTSDSEIIVNTGPLDDAVNIIAPDGAIRKPGQVIRACTSGNL